MALAIILLAGCELAIGCGHGTPPPPPAAADRGKDLPEVREPGKAPHTAPEPVKKPSPAEDPEKPSSPPEEPEGKASWKSGAKLSPAATAVLAAAFGTEHGPGEAGAYDFHLHGGERGMDWWNFPWDLPSSRPAFTLTYEDMKAMLEHVSVRPEPGARSWVRYSAMLGLMVSRLTPGIMNAHGGTLRVTKILYCVRNYLAVARRHGLREDIPHLEAAAGKLLALHATGKLLEGATPYTAHSSFDPRDPDGRAETRDPRRGIQALEALLVGRRTRTGA